MNRELGLQLACLTEIARKMNVPVLITNQVYSGFERKNQVKLVGGDIVSYGSKCLIELQNFKSNIRKVIIRKHRSIIADKGVYFQIGDKGIEKFDSK